MGRALAFLSAVTDLIPNGGILLRTTMVAKTDTMVFSSWVSETVISKFPACIQTTHFRTNNSVYRKVYQYKLCVPCGSLPQYNVSVHTSEYILES